VSTPNKFAALDSNVLLALGAGDDQCAEVIDGLGQFGFFFIVTETALQELSDIIENDPDDESRRHAQNAINNVTNWGFLTPSLTSIQMGVAERVAQDLSGKIITNGTLNDGLLLAEAAYNGCRMFITLSQPLLSSNRESMQLTLIGFDLCGVAVGAPSEIATALTVIREASKEDPKKEAQK